MSITTYSELKTALANWSKRSDLTSMLDDFIDLAEAKMSRALRTVNQETALATTALSSGTIVRPAAAVAFKVLVNDTDAKAPIEQKSLEYVLSHHSDSTTPMFYAWEGANLRFDTDAGNVYGVYYVGITGLSDAAPTNWLLTAAPDLYLCACLAELYYYTLDEQRATFNETKAAQLIEELNIRDKNNRFSGNSLVMRTK